MNPYIGDCGHILVVEDEAILAELIQNHLTAQGFASLGRKTDKPPGI